MDRSSKKIKICKCITASTRAIRQHAAHTTDQLTSPSCWTRAIQKAYLFTKNIEEFSGKSLEERTSRQKKIRQKGNRTRQKNKRGDSKVESNDSPEIPDRGETSDIPGLPSGATWEGTIWGNRWHCCSSNLLIDFGSIRKNLNLVLVLWCNFKKACLYISGLVHSFLNLVKDRQMWDSGWLQKVVSATVASPTTPKSIFESSVVEHEG